MAERADATIVEVPASHVSFVSQPEAATQLIFRPSRRQLKSGSSGPDRIVLAGISASMSVESTARSARETATT